MLHGVGNLLLSKSAPPHSGSSFWIEDRNIINLSLFVLFSLWGEVQAGHRLGTIEIENTLVIIPCVTEEAVLGLPIGEGNRNCILRPFSYWA